MTSPVSGCSVEMRSILVAEELDTHGQLLVHRDDLHRVAAHAERAAGERDVVALVLHVHELAQQLVAVDLLPLLEEQHAPGVFLGRAQAVDAETVATTTQSRRVSRLAVAAWRRRSTSSLMFESFSM